MVLQKLKRGILNIFIIYSHYIIKILTFFLAFIYISKNNALGSELNKSKDDSLGNPKSPLLVVSKSPDGSAPTSPKPSGTKFK